MQVLVHLDALLFPGHARRLQVELVDLRRTSGGMHHEIRLDRVLLRSRTGVDKQAIALPLDGGDCPVHMHLDAQFPAGLHEQSDEIGVKLLEGAAAAVEHLDLCACARCDVGELEGDVAAADEDDVARERIQVQELRAGGEPLLARYPQIGMARAGRDHDVATDQGVLAHLDARPIHKAGTAMPRDDPRLCKALLVLLRHRVGEGALETDQVRPAEGQARSGNALALHAAAPVHQVGNADEDLLWIAPAQLAGSSEGVVIDDGHAPAGLTAGIGDALGGRAGPQDNYINGCCCHSYSSCFFLEVASRHAAGCPSLSGEQCRARTITFPHPGTSAWSAGQALARG